MTTTDMTVDAGVRGLNRTQWTCGAGCVHATRYDARRCPQARDDFYATLMGLGRALKAIGYAAAYDKRNPYTRHDCMPTVPSRGYTQWLACVHAFASKCIADEYGYEAEVA